MVIHSYYSGDSTDMYEQWSRAPRCRAATRDRSGQADRHRPLHVIMVDPLGPGRQQPSTGLDQFPQYSYYDMVQANYRMLRDHLKVAQVALITGVSMGGTQTYVWGVSTRNSWAR